MQFTWKKVSFFLVLLSCVTVLPLLSKKVSEKDSVVPFITITLTKINLTLHQESLRVSFHTTLD